ncbi:MAG: PHP domain-containing protein [Clostridia bacterium]
MQIYDLHVHTKLSNCADRNAEASEYITLASEYEFAALGFTDHAWDSPRISGATDWYKRQPYERILECNYARDGKELPIFRGAEGEYASYLLGVTEETIKKLDYIIIPHSHIHMKNFVISSTFDTPDKKAQFLLNSFVSLCKTSEARYIFGIAHPFFPCGVSRDELDEIMSHLKVSDMLAAFEIARKNEIFIEFNTSCFNILPNDADN